MPTERRLRTLRGSLLSMAGAMSVVCCSPDGLDYLGAGSPDAATEIDSGTFSPPGPGGSQDAAPPGATPDATSPADSGPAGPGAPGDSGADALDATDSAPPASPPAFADAGATTWCTASPSLTFCADFDETALPAGFSSSDGAFLRLTSSLPSSASNDLLLLVPPQTGGGTYGSKLSRSFGQRASTATLAFDFYPETLNATSSGLLIAALDFLGSDAAKYSVRIAYNAGVPRVEESYLGAPADIYHSNFGIPTGAWSRVSVVLSFASADAGDAGAGGSTMSVYVNSVLQGTAEALSPPAGFDSRPALLVGAVYGTLPVTGWALRYDNVTLDLR